MGSVARAVIVVCDVCKKPTKRLVAKLFLTPRNDNNGAWNDYQFHADVGECCSSKVLQDIRWTKRKKEPHKGTKRSKELGESKREKEAAKNEADVGT